MEFKPLNNRVVVDPIKTEATTASGIVLPSQEGKPANRGRILAVADTVKEGQQLLGKVAVYGNYAGQTIDLNGTKVLIMQYEDILGVEG